MSVENKKIELLNNTPTDTAVSMKSKINNGKSWKSSSYIIDWKEKQTFFCEFVFLWEINKQA